jgi:hypothetical protein
MAGVLAKNQTKHIPNVRQGHYDYLRSRFMLYKGILSEDLYMDTLSLLQEGNEMYHTVLPPNPGWFHPRTEYPASKGVTIIPIS